MRKRGASIIWAIIISGIMMVVVTTMSSFIVKEAQLGIRMDDSAKAYAAASSGVEWAEDCIGNGDCNASLLDKTPKTWTFNFIGTGSNNPTTYAVTITKTLPTPPSTVVTYAVESLGTSGGVNRQIEYSYQSQDSGSFGFAPGDTSVTSGPLKITNANHFTLSFRYYSKNGTLDANTIFGLVDTSNPKHFLGVELDPGTIDLAASGQNGAYLKNESSLNSTAPSIKVGTGVLGGTDYYNVPLGITVTLDYYRGRSLVLTVTGNDINGSQCLGTKTWTAIDSSYELSGDITLKYGSIDDLDHLKPLDGPTTDSSGNPVYTATTSGGSAYFSSFNGSGIVPVTNHTLTVAGVGGSYTVNGTPYTTPVSLLEGSTASVVATADASHTFTSWTGCDGGTSTNPCKVTMSGDKIVTATFTAIQPPGPVNSFATGTATRTSIDLSWTAPTTGDPVDYYLINYSATGAAGPWTSFPATSLPSTTTVTGLSNNKTYWFKVVSHNGNPTSTDSVVRATSTLP